MESRLESILQRIDARGERRFATASTPVGVGLLARAGEALVDFASNDYLGLSKHPRLIERSIAWTERLGVGAGASRLVTGTREEHLALEQKIAAFKGTEAALLFPSGWHCNAAVLGALLKAGPDTLLVTDRLLHASLHAGAAGHRQLRYRHNDLNHLEFLLARHRDHAGPIIVVTESVFSMDGDRVDLAQLIAIARRAGAFLYLDEAHATGVLGPQGRGLSAEFPGTIDLVMGTFSKAFGCFGAYVAGSRRLIDYLCNACGGFIFSTAPPPAMLGAIDAALDLVPELETERARLAAMGDQLRALLEVAGIDAGTSSTQIVPVIVGEPGDALALSHALAAHGFLVPAIRPPSVPAGTSRLRIALHATHTKADVEQLADAIVGHPR